MFISIYVHLSAGSYNLKPFEKLVVFWSEMLVQNQVSASQPKEMWELMQQKIYSISLENRFNDNFIAHENVCFDSADISDKNH